MTAPDVAAALARLREELGSLAYCEEYPSVKTPQWHADLALVEAFAEREDAETVARRLHDACPVQSLFIRLWDEMYERERGYWLTMARALETPHPQPKKETQ